MMKSEIEIKIVVHIGVYTVMEATSLGVKYEWERLSIWGCVYSNNIIVSVTLYILLEHSVSGLSQINMK